MAEKKKDTKEALPTLKSPADEIAELTSTLQRLQADFDNYRKTVEKQQELIRKNAKVVIIAKLLPVIDSFTLALNNTQNKEEFTKGVELIYAQLFQTLEDLGVRPIPCTGKFDPYKHEVLLQEESLAEPGTIIEELQRGYSLDDHIIRFSKVKIAKKKANGQPSTDSKHTSA